VIAEVEWQRGDFCPPTGFILWKIADLRPQLDPAPD